MYAYVICRLLGAQWSMPKSYFAILIDGAPTLLEVWKRFHVVAGVALRVWHWQATWLSGLFGNTILAVGLLLTCWVSLWKLMLAHTETRSQFLLRCCWLKASACEISKTRQADCRVPMIRSPNTILASNIRIKAWTSVPLKAQLRLVKRLLGKNYRNIKQRCSYTILAVWCGRCDWWSSPEFHELSLHTEHDFVRACALAWKRIYSRL